MSDLKDFVIENGVLTKYVGDGGDVLIPIGVTELGFGAFMNCSNVISVFIPETVAKISDAAFANCIRLSTVKMPPSTKAIGSGAFRNCVSLTNLMIPSETLVEDGALFGCSNLADENGFIIHKAVLHHYCGANRDVTVPDTVKRIGNQSFYKNGRITSVTISESVEAIGIFAFAYCSSLVTVVIPDTVKQISWAAFNGCRLLESVNIPKGLVDVEGDIFKDCKNLSAITISEDLKKIDDQAFDGCDNVCRLILPESITAFEGSVLEVLWGTKFKTIMLLTVLMDHMVLATESKSLSRKIKANKNGIVMEASKTDNAEAVSKLLSLFENSISIEAVESWIELCKDSPQILAVLMQYKSLHYSSEYIEKLNAEKIEKELGAGDICDWKKVFRFKNNGKGVIITRYLEKDTEVAVIPNSIAGTPVVEIAEKAFKNRSSVTTVLIPETVTVIGSCAFENCVKLENVVISDNTLDIESDAFEGCANLPQQNGMIIIGGVLYKYCGSDERVVVPDGVIKIGDKAFCGSRGREIVLPESLKIIGYCSFFYSEFSVVYIPNGLAFIGDDAFRKSNVRRCTVPKDCRHIGDGAFEGCGGLADNKGLVIVNGIIFDCFFGGCDVVIPDGVTVISRGAFSDRQTLRSVLIPSSVVTIRDEAFRYCENLTIHAPAGSYAEQYAKENNIPCVAE